MRRSFYIKKRIFFVLLMAAFIFATCASPYYATSVYNNCRAKRSEEYQGQAVNGLCSFHTLDMDICLIQKSVNIKAALSDVSFYFDKLIMFFMLLVVLIFNLCDSFIKRWNILVSRTKNKNFMVHYLQMKDGKKNAPSFVYSF